MRELKFRCWDKVKKEYVLEGFYIIGEITVFDCVNQYHLESLNDLEVEQFTGQLDCQGKEIYEGDVVSVSYKLNSDIDSFTGKVVFQEGGFQLVSDEETDWLSYFDDHMEVIGNIHEKGGG